MEGRKWEDLGSDCLAEVFEKVGLQDLLLDVPLVCKSWHKASLLPRCWKNLDFQSLYRYHRVFPHNNTELIQLAVTRSRGTATRILLSDYCAMENLQYIANECPLLAVLRLPPMEATKEELQSIPELISKFKELEILRIGGRGHFDLKGLVPLIGTNCPKFVGLVVNDIIDMEMASTFAHFLPNIKWLNLRGSYLPRESLVCILHGCRELLFLNVNRCIGFDENDAEISKLASHVKTFMSLGSKLQDDFDEYDSLNANDFDEYSGRYSD